MLVAFLIKNQAGYPLIPHDDKPDVVDIALGNKEGDIYSSSEYEPAKISEAAIVGIQGSKLHFIIDLVKFINMVKRLKKHLTIFPPLCLYCFLSAFFTSQVPL